MAADYSVIDGRSIGSDGLLYGLCGILGVSYSSPYWRFLCMDHVDHGRKDGSTVLAGVEKVSCRAPDILSQRSGMMEQESGPKNVSVSQLEYSVTIDFGLRDRCLARACKSRIALHSEPNIPEFKQRHPVLELPVLST